MSNYLARRATAQACKWKVREYRTDGLRAMPVSRHILLDKAIKVAKSMYETTGKEYEVVDIDA